MKAPVSKAAPAFALSLFLLGCAVPERLTANRRLPKATAEVSAECTADRNVRLALTIENLVPPEKLDPAASTYVVWTQPHDSTLPAQNVGAMKIGDDRTGHLETLTPFRRFRLFVTAERTDLPDAPRGEPLFWTDITRSAR